MLGVNQFGLNAAVNASRRTGTRFYNRDPKTSSNSRDDSVGGSSEETARETNMRQLRCREHVLYSVGATEAAFNWGTKILSELESNPSKFTLDGFLSQKAVAELKELVQIKKAQMHAGKIKRETVFTEFNSKLNEILRMEKGGESEETFLLDFAQKQLGANRDAIFMERFAYSFALAHDDEQEKLYYVFDKLCENSSSFKQFLKEDPLAYDKSVSLMSLKSHKPSPPYCHHVSSVARQVVADLLGLDL